LYYYHWATWLGIGVASFIIFIMTAPSEIKVRWANRLMDLERECDRKIREADKDD